MAGYRFTMGHTDIWEVFAGFLMLMLLALGWWCAWPALLMWLKINLRKPKILVGPGKGKRYRREPVLGSRVE